MSTRVAPLFVASLALFAACGWSGFEPRDRELARCWPRCGPDAAEVDAGLDGDAGAVPDVRDVGESAADARADAHGDQPDAREEGDRDAGHDDARDLIVLEASLPTPNSLTFVWDGARVPEAATGYVLRFGTQAGVVEGGGGAVWDAEDDGNLAFRTSPHGPGLVERTTVTGLDPSTTYTARLYALIPAQGELAVARGSGRTIATAETGVEVYAEELHGEAMREGFEDPALASRAHTGTRSLWLNAAESESTASVSNLAVSIPAIPEARFADAYLELSVYVEFAGAGEPVYFVETELSGAHPGEFVYSYTALPPRAGWNLVQLAVRGFVAEPAQRLEDVGLGESLVRFAVRAEWPFGSTVFIDDVSFRY